MSHTLTELQAIVHEWANEQFPDRPPAAGWMKLFEELGEVIRDPTDRLEWADVFIMLLDLAAIYGVTLDAAILEKMEVNRQRVWAKTETGVMSHVKGATPAPPLTTRYTIQVDDTGPLFDLRTGGSPFEYDFALTDPVPPPHFYPSDVDPGCYVFVEEMIGLGRRRWSKYRWSEHGVPF